MAAATSNPNCPLSHTKVFSAGKEVLVAYRCILWEDVLLLPYLTRQERYSRKQRH